jgi:hypothetical protein
MSAEITTIRHRRLRVFREHRAGEDPLIVIETGLAYPQQPYRRLAGAGLTREECLALGTALLELAMEPA